jgi:hypothetical protein
MWSGITAGAACTMVYGAPPAWVCAWRCTQRNRHSTACVLDPVGVALVGLRGSEFWAKGCAWSCAGGFADVVVDAGVSEGAWSCWHDPGGGPLQK